MVTSAGNNNRPAWFVFAQTRGTPDQTPRFVRDGIWENVSPTAQRFSDLVNSIRPGDRIAIKSLHKRSPDSLPFEYGKEVHALEIKATGVVTGNPEDGRNLAVDWTLLESPRWWYFYTNSAAVQRVPPMRTGPENAWKSEGLLRFTFENEDQDVPRFLGAPDDPVDLPDDETETRTDFTALADELYLPPDFLEEINILLEDKKQVIFQGPPGTGKTYVAQAIAERLAGLPDRVTLVQFHPSYAYEDFVQGFRPAPIGGQPSFKLKEGPLLRAAKRAEAEPDASHFLIIDEINRGNLAKVFGELYFLLEYRDKAISLQYTEESFGLPDNLYVIGTMNTADRSIALVDLALRRRFYFVEFHPADKEIGSVLRKYLAKNAPNMRWVADVVDKANEQLQQDERDAAIGPSYFMKENLNEGDVEIRWQHSVMPYIRELLFGQDSRIADFELDKLRGNAPPPQPASAEEDADSDNVTNA